MGAARRLPVYRRWKRTGSAGWRWAQKAIDRDAEKREKAVTDGGRENERKKIHDDPCPHSARGIASQLRGGADARRSGMGRARELRTGREPCCGSAQIA